MLDGHTHGCCVSQTPVCVWWSLSSPQLLVCRCQFKEEHGRVSLRRWQSVRLLVRFGVYHLAEREAVATVQGRARPRQTLRSLDSSAATDGVSSVSPTSSSSPSSARVNRTRSSNSSLVELHPPRDTSLDRIARWCSSTTPPDAAAGAAAAGRAPDDGATAVGR